MHHSGAHDATLVGLSILIAVVSSYTALDLASRMKAAMSRAYWAWLAASAVAMGGGIWAMHFVAMLAFRVPGQDANYDFTLTFVSLALPIAVTAVGFYVATNSKYRALAVMLGGLVMGLGIAAMHYTGMAAMRMPADITYDPSWVAVSILIAIGAAMAALWLAFLNTSAAVRFGAAVVMGLAVSGMHYAAMQGVILTVYQHGGGALEGGGFGRTPLAVWIAGTTFFILLLSLAAAAVDRRFAFRLAREATVLRESEERFRLLLQGVTDYAIFMLDAEGRVANWNAGAERIKGYSAQEIIGSHISRFYTAEDLEADGPAKALAKAAESGKFACEGWRVRQDGSQFRASVVIQAIRSDAGVLLGFAKVTRDVTERRQAQEDLERTREALAQAQKMEAVGQLTGGVAHDFNNLLMAVLGSLELLKKRLPDEPRYTRLLDNAIQGAQRGAALTQRMLAFARRQDLNPTATDIPDLVRGMADLLQRSIGPTVRIETRFPLRSPRAVVDAHQLELALLNLVVNARDAMPAEGEITISVRESSDDDSVQLPSGRYLCLSVTDTGEGMDEATLARAQEPFFTTKGVGKGTGLGLSMVHGLAEQSSGRLVLRSRLGEGTSAEIWLPVAEDIAEPEPLAAPAVRSVAATRSLGVLLVDDDPLVLENAAVMLEDLGHRVIEARTGQQALDLISELRDIDLVITDHAMPGMTGSQLAERLLSENPSLPIILATGYAEFQSVPSLGIPKLNKPFSQTTLAEAIAFAIERTREDEKVVAFRPRC